MWATNDIDAGTNKAHLYKKALTLTSTDADTLMFNVNSYTFTEGKVVMDYVKGRIILCADNKVYEITPTSNNLPSPIFTHTNTSYTFTSVTESGAAIYVRNTEDGTQILEQILPYFTPDFTVTVDLIPSLGIAGDPANSQSPSRTWGRPVA